MAEAARRRPVTATASSRNRAVRAVAAALAVAIATPGCANRQLQLSTRRQSQTIIELQYQQVLDNLAMTCLNPSALPSLTALRTGATQVGDTGSLGFLGVAGLNTTFGSSPTVAATRSIVDQWGSAPVTDDNALRLLRKAFQSALGSKQLLTLDEAEDLAHDISTQIGTTADMSVDRDTLNGVFSESLLSSLITQRRNPALGRNPPPDTAAALAVEREEGEYLDRLAVQLAKINEKIDSKITNTLDEKILAVKYAPGDGGPPRMRFTHAAESATGQAKQAIYLVNDIQETLDRIPMGWFRYGPEKPKDACYVGHATFCGRGCYVWVCPDGLAGLADFVLAVLKIESTFKDVQVVTAPSGIQFAPALTNPGR
jgi:hypothetical protein